MSNYTCEEPCVCTNFQSAICLHCNRRLCLPHITEHNQMIPSSIQNLSNEIETILQHINDEYEKSRDTCNNLLTSLNDWRTQQTEKIQHIYDNHLQCIESHQEALNITQQELTDILDRDARKPLELIQHQHNTNVKRIDHIQQTIKKIRHHSTNLKWNFSISPPVNIEYPPKNISSTTISIPTTSTDNNQLIPKKKLSSKYSISHVVNLRRYRAFRRLIELFDNISSMEQTKIDIAAYIEKQGPHFPLPILICSYLTAWHRKTELNDKLMILNEHISTIAKYIANRNKDYITLLGIHGFFYNENIQENKREMMTFLLQHFVDHQCITRNQIINWYNNKDLNGYQGFDGAKQLTAPFIKSFWANTTSTEVQTISINSTTMEQSDNIQIKEEPTVSS